MLAHRRTSTLQRAVQGRHVDLEQLGRVGCRPAEHVAEHERCTLTSRQVLDRRDECQLDRFFPDDFGVRARICIFFEIAIRERLQPRDLLARYDWNYSWI